MYSQKIYERLAGMTTTLSIRIDRELKEDVEELLSDLGMNVTTAITCFFRKMRDVQGIPFAIGRGKGAHRAAATAARSPKGAFAYPETAEGEGETPVAAEAVPFEDHVPNAETRAVLERDRAGLEPSYGPFDSTEEMFKAALAMED